MRLYKLKFHSALHVESRGTGEPDTADEFIRSDTLSAALCLAWADLYPDKGDDFFICPPFRLSSAFPYIEESLLYPMPAWPVWKEMDTRQRKTIKKVRWLSAGLMAQVCRGEPLDFNNPDKMRYIAEETVCLTPSEYERLAGSCRWMPWCRTERQRVSVDRFDCSTEDRLYFFGLQFFAESAGLYFIADIDHDMQQSFEAALQYLGDTGIGGDRNSGLGHFRITHAGEYQPPEEGPFEGWLNISLFNPEPEAPAGILDSPAYRLERRGGWISRSTVGRPPIRVFSEGSYFHKKPEGRVVPMLDEAVRREYELPIGHSAPRDFRAIALPCAKPQTA